MATFLGPAILGTIGTAGARYFQKRAFAHKDDAEQRSYAHEAESRRKATEVQHATEVFERLSTAMDQRLYAMRRVNWGLSLDYITKEETDARWQAYDQILVAWNSNLSKNLAMNERYFGDTMRVDLATIQQSFRSLHDQLVVYRYEDKAPEDFNGEADAVNEQIHLINSRMIRLIQTGKVGIFHPDGDLEMTAAEKRNKENRSLQEYLNQVLGTDLEIDGLYGPKTRAAVRRFQKENGLKVDGKAGPKTRDKIREVLEGAESEG